MSTNNISKNEKEQLKFFLTRCKVWKHYVNSEHKEDFICAPQEINIEDIWPAFEIIVKKIVEIAEEIEQEEGG